MAYGECVTNIGTDPWDLREFENLNNVDNLARMIYSEARGESVTGKRGCYYVVVNRKAKNLPEFGGNTVNGILLQRYQFSGMTTSYARCPDTSSQGWQDSLSVALNGGTNPIGKCLWFNTNSMYSSSIKIVSGKEYYTFNGGATYQEVVEKVVIGNHTFFRVSGY